LLRQFLKAAVKIAPKVTGIHLAESVMREHDDVERRQPGVAKRLTGDPLQTIAHYSSRRDASSDYQAQAGRSNGAISGKQREVVRTLPPAFG
jgi:hypothetical protein